MSAILVYSEDHEGFDYLCPGFDTESDAFDYFKTNEHGITVLEETWSEGDEENVIGIEHNGKSYEIEFLYIDEPIYINTIGATGK